MTTMLRCLWVAAAALLAEPSLAQATAPAVKLLPAQSEIVFTSRQMGVPVEGRFTKFDAQISLDPKQAQSGNVAFSIDMGSATLGLPEIDAELGKPGWFDAAKFRQATFQSSAIKSLGAARFEVGGRIAIKGSAQDVVVPVSLTRSGGITTATGSFTLQRLAFRVGAAEWADTSLVANDVQVRFRFVLSGMGAL